MKNGKHKTNSFDSFNSWSKKQTYSLPFREGAGGRLFPSQGAAHPQNKCSKCFGCFRCFRCFISLLDQKNARFWSKSEQNRCFKCFKCSKCSAFSLPSLQGGAGGRLSPNQARSATNQASLRAANQVRSATNLFLDEEEGKEDGEDEHIASGGAEYGVECGAGALLQAVPCSEVQRHVDGRGKHRPPAPFHP